MGDGFDSQERREPRCKSKGRRAGEQQGQQGQRRRETLREGGEGKRGKALLPKEDALQGRPFLRVSEGQLGAFSCRSFISLSR